MVWLAIVLVLTIPFGFYLLPPIAAALTPPPPVPAVSVPPYQQAPQVLDELGSVGQLTADAPIPDPAVLQTELDAALNLSGPGQARAVVIDAIDQTELYNRDGAEPSVPASNMKVLTALSALNSMDPYGRLATRVVQGDGESSVVLVAGGDTLMALGRSNSGAVNGRAGIQTLAERTAEALADAGVEGEVTVSLDDGLFQGDTVSAAWHPGDVAAGEATGVYPIAIDSAWGAENRRDRPRDAALSAAQAFRAALNTAGRPVGITAGGDVARVSGYSGSTRESGAPSGAPSARPSASATPSGGASGGAADGSTGEPSGAASGSSSGDASDTPSGDGTPSGGAPSTPSAGSARGEELARVESATITEQVTYMLEESDNVLAEVLGRLAARAQGNVPSFAGATQAVRSTLTGLEIDVEGVEIADVSGLALGDRIPATVLADVVRYLVSADAPPANQVLLGMSVSGQSGSLTERGLETEAVGRVHAKTGTLNATSALSGYVVTADSRLLVFSIIYNGLDGNIAEAEAALDRAAAVLAGCGCG